MYVELYVAIQLLITKQSGHVLLVILLALPHSMYMGRYMHVCMYVYMYACTYMYVCMFIKLHITAQSGPVIRVILCHSH